MALQYWDGQWVCELRLWLMNLAIEERNERAMEKRLIFIARS